MNKELIVEIPEGYEIDKKNSTFEHIVFKEKQLTYEDIIREMYDNKPTHWISGFDSEYDENYKSDGYYNDPNLMSSQKHVDHILAYNMLLNVAIYMNRKYKQENQFQYYIGIYDENVVTYSTPKFFDRGQINFNTEEAAIQAIKILGKDLIKQALRF